MEDPGEPAARPVVVLVHGAWHGSWCWEQWIGPIEDAGFEVRTVDLPHHDVPGARRRLWATMGTYVAALDEVVAAIDGEVILVGHSMGGLVVQRHLEARSARAAILVAPVPRRGVVAATLRQLRQHPGRTLAAIATLDLWPLVATPTRARELFFTPSTADDRVGWTAERLQNESYLAYLSMMLRWARPSRVTTPVTVVAAELDGVFTVREQRALAEAYGTELTVLEGTGHDAMLDDGAAASAATLIGLLGRA